MCISLGKYQHREIMLLFTIVILLCTIVNLLCTIVILLFTIVILLCTIVNLLFTIVILFIILLFTIGDWSNSFLVFYPIVHNRLLTKMVLKKKLYYVQLYYDCILSCTKVYNRTIVYYCTTIVYFRSTIVNNRLLTKFVLTYTSQ